MTEDMKVLTSLLDECIAEISSLHIKIKNLEDKITTLEQNNQKLELSHLPVKQKAIALSELSTDPELSSNIQALIDKAVDSIIRYGQKIPYIERGG